MPGYSGRWSSVNSLVKPQSAATYRGTEEGAVAGEFLTIAGERYYAIRNVDQMEPFFISVVSNDDHWLFISSTGGLTAGRVSPDTSLFPYISVDKIHESAPHTGSKTLLRCESPGGIRYWEPFGRANDAGVAISRNLYKNVLGNKLCFEEVNRELGLVFRYTWLTGSYGFVRECELQNIGEQSIAVELVDGLQNILPAGTPIFAQTHSSNLVNAYKWTELDEPTGLAYVTLCAGISDRAEPCESLKATTVFCLGLEGAQLLLSTEQLTRFQQGRTLRQENLKRGVRAAYLVNYHLELAPSQSSKWRIVAELEQSQSEVTELRRQLRSPAELGRAISSSVQTGSDELARIMATADGFQVTAEEEVQVHHYANVLFNVLRGGVFNDQYRVSIDDFRSSVWQFNHQVATRHEVFLDGLPDNPRFDELLLAVQAQGDSQLQRLTYEYLPITFGRRHGDPSRPWNWFEIRLKDDHGNRLLSYQGNWRDIFQNWEALAFSFPDFVENIMAKFVNASTVDGYNPYRITKQGIDWEMDEPDNPWSHIGYWGDHQVIYLLKLLELSRQFHPSRLRQLLREPIFCYANVPYRIKSFAALLKDPKSTVVYDHGLAGQIEKQVEDMGADGKLLLDTNYEVYQVNLLEKLLVPLLGKLGNLVIDGGIWMNTQRPEWNDANNALVGQGLSMVTLCYMRRYIRFLQQLLEQESGSFELSKEVGEWLVETTAALGKAATLLGESPISERQRYTLLVELGRAASRYREKAYAPETFSGTVDQPLDAIMRLLDLALSVTHHSIGTNRRRDGLYHAYNLLDLKQEKLAVDALYPMLEGQVAVLSSGALSPQAAVDVLEALFESPVYRADQHSFMLYPDRNIPGFLEKNRISEEQLKSIPLLVRMLLEGDERIVLRDADGCLRFNARFTNTGDLTVQLDRLAEDFGDELETSRASIQALYEAVFRHKAFTGRSGTMFGFEGLGSVYWHMVSKLLLAVQENFFAAIELGANEATCRRLGQLYYRVREGLGFNKTPQVYGAFPTDPYSHTPKHAGARQPGMTGQVKEELLSRFGELGLRVEAGAVRFQPALLRFQEFIPEPRQFRFLDVDGNWRTLSVPRRGLAFTWCQIPVVYRADDDAPPSLSVMHKDGAERIYSDLALSENDSAEMFERSGRIHQLRVTFPTSKLFIE